ncbi:MAG: ergothioneine biosynthesis protein EgtB [Planctomycetes bacterium]|nr:ergothioneine biosynthesis protein EgtB [Planctomycetota bacterium]
MRRAVRRRATRRHRPRTVAGRSGHGARHRAERALDAAPRHHHRLRHHAGAAAGRAVQQVRQRRAARHLPRHQQRAGHRQPDDAGAVRPAPAVGLVGAAVLADLARARDLLPRRLPDEPVRHRLRRLHVPPPRRRRSGPAGAAAQRLTRTLSVERSALTQRFTEVRARSERLMAPLASEDFRAQSMPDVSPPYWNLGHTSWFFAANLLQPLGRMPDGFAGMDYALNSYYEGLGPRLDRARRGAVAQPTTDDVRRYRTAVDAAMLRCIAECCDDELARVRQVVTIGCEHEEQHQELFVTELLHIRWSAPEPLRRAYRERRAQSAGAGAAPPPLRAIGFDAATTTLGHQGPGLAEGGFCWDNELPAHAALVGDFALADRLITNAEWCAFVDDGGYRDPLLWLSNGWAFVQRERLDAPLYWQRDGARWRRFTLRGLVDVDPAAPVCHVSFYEAEAFARWFGEQRREWRGARLPREVEWEHAARQHGFDPTTANLLHDDLDRCAFDVEPAAPGDGLRQLAGTAWEWTQSHYEPYPGYRPFDGALMEYNGKFMDNQRVLRGGSFATPRGQARVAYRNFWSPGTRFQASSLRLCLDR